MIRWVPFLLLGFTLIFAAGVTCSVICPERPIVPAKTHQEDGPCTDCTSTDFVGGAKVSVERVPLNVTTVLDLDFFAASSSFVSLSGAFPTNTFLESSPPLLVT